MLTRLRTDRGLTLTEIMIASAIGVFMVLGMVRVDAGRTGMGEKIRAATGLIDGQGDAARAMMLIGRDIQEADRINVIGFGPGGDLQLRVFRPAANCGTGCVGGVPDPCCFDIAANHRWIQYRVTGTQLRYYANDAGNCTGMLRLAGGGLGVGGDITAFTLAYPANNIVSFGLNWSNAQPAPGTRVHNFTDRVAARSVSNGNLNTTANDSGSGLAAPGVSNPPAGCP